MKKDKMLISIIIVLIIIIGVLLAIFIPPLLMVKEESGNDNDSTKKIEVTEEVAKEYLQNIGIYENLGCYKSIIDIGYSDDFKAIAAIRNAMISKGVVKECDEVFDESQKIDDNTYKGKSGYCYNTHKAKVVDYNTANSIYKDSFGGELPKKSYSGININGMYYIFLDYVESSDSFASISCGGCGGSCNVGYSITEYKTFKVEGKQLKIDVYHTLDTLETENHHESYYINKYGEKIECENPEECQEQVKNKYLDKLDVYEVIFEESDGNYIFQSVSKK